MIALIVAVEAYNCLSWENISTALLEVLTQCSSICFSLSQLLLSIWMKAPLSSWQQEICWVLEPAAYNYATDVYNELRTSIGEGATELQMKISFNHCDIKNILNQILRSVCVLSMIAKVQFRHDKPAYECSRQKVSGWGLTTTQTAVWDEYWWELWKICNSVAPWNRCIFWPLKVGYRQSVGKVKT